jgi:NADH-quinone oxidoreductase subunit I
MSFGGGLLKGMAVTAKNFVASYFKKERLVTVQYPEQVEPPKENFRNIPFLIFDGDVESGTRCVACKICEQECPPQCIYIEQTYDEAGNSLKKPKVFDIDLTVCMNCGLCAETCPFDAIKMDSVFELSTTGRFYEQLATKERLLKPNEYYHKIKPTEATAVDARLAAKKKPPPKKDPPPAAPKPAEAAEPAKEQKPDA